MLKSVMLITALLCLSSCNKGKEPLVHPADAPALPPLKIEELVKLLEQPGPALLDGLNRIDLKIEPAPEIYKSFFKSCNIRESYLLREKFSQGDLFYIMQAGTFNNLAYSAVTDKPKEEHISALFEFVTGKLGKVPEGSKDYHAYPATVLERGFGHSDRQSWVLCELAYQLGGDSYIIKLKDAETGVLRHTICEVRYNNKSYILDPFYEKFIENRTLTKLSQKEITQIWSDKLQLHKAFKDAEIYSPSMPQEYCPRFTALGKYLSGKTKFRIGEDPRARAKRRGMIKGEKLAFWDYPVLLLQNFKPYNDSR